MNGIEALLKFADLNIIDHSIDIRRSMNSRDRVMPFYVMSYIQKGRAVLRIGQQEYETRAGSLALIPIHTKHDHFMTTEEETIYLWWHFNFTVAGIIDVIRLLNLPVTYTLKNPAYFEEAFLRYLKVTRAGDTLPNFLLRKAVAIEVLARLFEEMITYSIPESSPQGTGVFMRIFTDIASHTGGLLTLKELSEKYGLNATYISNRFKEYFGITPIAMQKEIRLERAKVLLRSTDMSIGDIALLVGYSDIFTFSHFFTEKMGVNPSKYRSSFML